MPHDTKSIKKDLDVKPVPQYFNPAVDDYEVLQGRNGASRVEIYGPDGNPISTTSGKLNVRASELEALLTALGAKDFATQTTLAQILAKIIPAPATEAKQDALIAKDFATETTLGAGIVSLLSAIAENASETTTAAILAKLEAGIDTTLTGSIVTTETDKAVTADTDILADYTATKTTQTTLMVATNTSGILKLEVDGSLNSLNGGVALENGKWYAFDIPVLAESVYNLQFSVNATLQIKWIGGF
jgi:hypothetical protein